MFSSFLSGRHRRAGRNFLRDESGIILALFALSLPVLLLAVALTINFIGPLRELTKMQIAADAAARAGSMVQVLNIIDGSKAAKVQSEALAVAAANNYGNNPPYTTVTVNVPPLYMDQYHPPSAGSIEYYKNPGLNAVEVIITQQYNFLMLPQWLNFFGWTSPPLDVRSVAAWNFAPCIVALNPSPTGTTGVTFSSTGTAVEAACGIYSNNPDTTSSVKANGTCDGQGPTVSTYYVGMVGATSSVNSAGICGINGGTPIISSNMSPIADPFGALKITPPATTYSSATDFGSTGGANDWSDITKPLLPGRYTGNITFNGSKTITMTPGVYYFEGKLTVNGQTINAPYTSAQLADKSFVPTEGVTIIMADKSGSISVGAGGSGGEQKCNVDPTAPPPPGNLNISAPLTGPTAGMALISYDGSQVGFQSSGTIVNVNGVVYAPNALISFNSPVCGLKTCLTLVGSAISVSGGGSIGGACPAKMMNASGFRAAGLVE